MNSNIASNDNRKRSPCAAVPARRCAAPPSCSASGAITRFWQTVSLERALIRLFFVALMVLALASCGAQQSAAPKASPDEQTTTQRSAVEETKETTATPTTVAEPEEEP